VPDEHRAYLPAAGRDWALPLYDCCVTLLGINATRKKLIEQASIQPGQRVLEIGCGTGSLVLRIKRQFPDVQVVGLDPDPKALARARAKARGLPVRFDRAFADAMPYEDETFDCVLSSFMFHHLKSAERVTTLAEIRRVLKAGGSLHLLDFAGHRPNSSGLVIRMFHSRRQMRDNAEDRVLALMTQAGLGTPERLAHGRVLFGLMRVNYYRARRLGPSLVRAVTAGVPGAAAGAPGV
jgi:ubiquinone/menaquinone biosynthesis C-methylase UbiE